MVKGLKAPLHLYPFDARLPDIFRPGKSGVLLELDQVGDAAVEVEKRYIRFLNQSSAPTLPLTPSPQGRGYLHGKSRIPVSALLGFERLISHHSATIAEKFRKDRKPETARDIGLQGEKRSHNPLKPQFG